MPRSSGHARAAGSTAALRARWALAVAALLACPAFVRAAAEAGAPEGLLVRRRVVARDVIVPPAVIDRTAGGGSCPANIGDAVDGDEIRLWVTPAAARRDEPGWSAILRLESSGKGVVHLLFHADRAFTTLRYPVPQKRLWVRMRRAVEEAGEGKFFAQTPQGAVATASAIAAGVAVEERRLTTLDGFGHRKDFELQLEPADELGRVAFALEALVQAIRHGGDDWLAMTGAGSGVPLGLAVTHYHPETSSRYAEEPIARERQAIPADRFTVPAGYSEVPFAPDCF